MEIIFLNSLKNKNILDDWKRADVTPMFNEGAKKDLGNYGPVRLTSQVGKVLELILVLQISL